MQLAINGIDVIVPDAALQRLVLERLQSAVVPSASDSYLSRPPRIGEAWPDQGGIYAGIVAGEEGGPDYHHIIGRELEPASYGDQIAAASAATDGGFTWDLPYRREQRLEFCNVRRLYKAEAYWSKEQHASFSDYAWLQDFYDGFQGYWLKGSELRARLVRRLPI